MPRFLGTITYIGSDGVQHTLDEYNGNVIDAGNGGLAIKEYPDGASNGGSVANNTIMAMSLGEGTYAGSDNQFVVGKYNNNDNNNLFEVGNGASDSDRNNAFEVTEDGIARAYSAPSGPNDLVRAQDLSPVVRATVAISSDNLTLTLSSATPSPLSWYKFVDWGDGNFSEFSNTHTYSTQGTYTCDFYGVTNINAYAFYGCTKLTNITVLSGIARIYQDAFYGCTSLTSITIPDGVKGIGFEAFRGCTSLAYITIPDSVTGIESSAFYGCTSLTSITIPDGVTSIKSSAFRGCTSLTSATIPYSVRNIESNAFLNCTRLSKIYYKKTGTEWSAITISDTGNNDLANASKYYNCTPIDLSKYTIIKTTDQSVQGSDGVIVLITEASV